MRVAVTAKDITDGERGNSLRCPVALALKRITGRDWEVLKTVAYPTGSTERYPLPLAATAWLAHSDAGADVEPFAFALVA
jgi:hypothetical protein